MSPRLVLINLWQNKQWFYLIVVTIVYTLNFIILLKLGFRLGSCAVRLKRILTWSLGLAIFSTIFKPFIDDLFFMIIINSLTILLYISGGLRPLKSIAIMAIVLLLALAGFSLIQGPLIAINPKILSFLYSNRQGLGIATGTTIEFLFPLIVLVLSKRIDFSKQVFKKSYRGIEVGLVVVSVTLLLILYYAQFDLIYTTDKVTRYFATLKVVAGWIFTVVGIYVLYKINIREQRLIELEELFEELEISDAKKEVLKMKLKGMTNEEIAKERGVAISTVKTQVNELRKEVDYETLAEKSGAPVKKAGRPSEKEGEKRK